MAYAPPLTEADRRASREALEHLREAASLIDGLFSRLAAQAIEDGHLDVAFDVLDRRRSIHESLEYIEANTPQSMSF